MNTKFRSLFFACAFVFFLCALFCGNATFAQNLKLSPSKVKAEIENLGQWFLISKNDSFLHSGYDFRSGDYSDQLSYRSHLKALLALTQLSKFRNKAAYSDLVLSGKDFFRDFLRCHPEYGTYFLSVKGKSKSFYAAMYTLALSNMSNLDKQEEYLSSFGLGLLSLLKDDGSLRGLFYSTGKEKPESYAGQVMFALVVLYEVTSDKKYLDAAIKAFSNYAQMWRERKSSKFIPWFAQAYTKIYKITADSQYLKVLTEMGDYLVRRQQTKLNNTSEKNIGAFGAQVGSLKTAVFIPELIAMHSAVRRQGDTKRARRYQDAITLATRFVLSLQMSDADESSNHLKSSGAFRSSFDKSVLDLGENADTLRALIAVNRFLKTVKN